MNVSYFLFFIFFGEMFFFQVRAESKLEVEVYPLGLSDFEVSERIANAIVSPDGKVVSDKNGNRLILLDYPEKRDALRQALTQVQPPSCNVRMKVSFIDSQLVEMSEFGIRGAGKANPVELKSGQIQNLGLDLHEESTRTDSFVEQELIVMSGGKAHLRIGTSHPYAEWIYQYGVLNGFWMGSVGWKEVGARLIVEPYVLPNQQIRIRLTPEMSYLINGENLSTSIESLMTEVVVSNGQEIDLGGIPTSNREFYSKFLIGKSNQSEQKSLQIKLKSTIEQIVVP